MILVTGATGTVGREVLIGLQAANLETRAAVTDSTRATSTLPPEMSVVRFDFADPNCFATALDGVRRVFLMRPPEMADPSVFMPFLRALKAARLEQVVFLSLLGAEKNPVVPHRKIELEIMRLGLPHVFLRPSFFMQNLSGVHLADIRDRDDLFVPAGQGRTSFIDARDIAEVAVRCLSLPHLVNGGIDLTGAQALSYAEVAHVFSEVLGRSIQYRDPSPLRFGREMERRGMKREYINLMILIYNTNRFGLAAQVTDDVARILGRAPRSLEDFVRDFRAWFEKGSS
jgi:uncharacterized protein YbjT (DUF2867 family)